MAEVTDPDLLKQLNVAPAVPISGAAPSDAPSGLVTDPELLKKLNAGASEKPSVAADVAKSIGSGVLSGPIAAAGTPGDVANLLAKGSKIAGDYIGGKLGFDKSPEIAPPVLPTTEGIKSSIGNDSAIGQAVNFEPQTGLGKVAKVGTEFATNPFSYIGPGGALAKGATAAASGVGSEWLGQLADANKSQYAPLYRLAGAIAGGHALATPPRIITPNLIDPERQAMLDVLRNEGVTSLTAGQKIGSKPLKYTESVMADQPFASKNAEQINENAANQFTQAALRRVGEDAPRATPEVIDRSFNRIGNQFDRLTARNTMALDQPVQNDLLNTTLEYHNNVNPLMRSPVVENTMNDVATWAGQQGGQLTGSQYQNLRSRLASAARGSNDPQLSHALSDMSESLDNAMERSIAQTNPQDAGAFADARRQYRNMLVIERAATSGGAEKVGQGIITPAALSNATKAVMGRRSFARGQDDFSELAHAGTGIMMPLPQSGTAPRENIIHHLQLAGLLSAEPAAYAAGANPVHMGAAALGGLVAPALAGRAIMSPPVQGYMARGLIPDSLKQRYPAIRSVADFRVGTSPSTIALMNEIRGNQQARAKKNQTAPDAVRGGQ